MIYNFIYIVLYIIYILQIYYISLIQHYFFLSRLCDSELLPDKNGFI